MNVLRGVPLERMRVGHLRATVAAMHGGNVSRWSKQKCLEWLAEHGVREVDVGKLCRTLLRIVMRINDDGFPVGLHYADMTEIVKRHFPNSAVTERHFSWYATQMRAAGEVIPVYREQVDMLGQFK